MKFRLLTHDQAIIVIGEADDSSSLLAMLHGLVVIFM